MAKYCIFCGEELNANAIFCSACGKRQETETKKTEKKVALDIDTNSAEEDLLSFLGIMSSTQAQKKSPSIEIEKPAPSVQETVIEEPEEDIAIGAEFESEFEQEDINEDESNDIFIEEDLTDSNNSDSDISEKKEEYTEEIASEDLEEDIFKELTDFEQNEEEIDTDIPEQEPEEDVAPVQEPVMPTSASASRRRRVASRQSENTIEQETESEEKEEIQSIKHRQRIRNVEQLETNDEERIIRNNSDIFAQDDLLSSTIVESTEDLEIKEDDDLQEKLRKVRASRKNQTFEIKKRHFVESMDEEDDEFQTTLSDNDDENNFLKQDKLTADEIATNEKRKKAIIIEDEDMQLMEERSKMEGRKKPNAKNQPQKRRQSLRNIDERKIYEIEQDKSQLEEDDDPNYDGYYENVLPIDHDVIRKKKIDPKTILILLGTIGALVAVFYFCLAYLGIL